jgi:hemolysin activation/secretion protein
MVAGLCAGSFHAAGQTAATGVARHFDIMEYVVDGNTVLAVPDIEEAVYPFLGEARTADDVDKARKALEEAYQKHGFQTVQVSIPQQGVESGIVHLQVAENPVGRLRVVDAQYHLPSAIKATAPSVAEGKVIDMAAVQKDIVALNQSPGLRVTPQLKAGKDPGTVDVDLKVEDTLPLHASLEINDQHNQDTTPLRLVGTVGYDNLWQLGHSLSLTYEIAPEDQRDAKVFSGSYLARIPDSPVSLLVYGIKSDSDVAALASTDVIGRGNIFGLRAVVNLPGGDGFFQSVTAGIDRKDLTQNVLTLNVPSNAPVLYYPVTLAYHASLTGGGAETQLDASLNFSVAGLGSNSTKFDTQRYDALRQYFYLKAGASRLQPLGGGYALFARIDGQITGDSLLSSEQLSAGGANSVRGYLEAERIGDYGARATVELRTPSFGEAVSAKINDWHMLVFADGAALALRNPLAGEQSSISLGSLGVGTRLTAFDDLNAALDIAFPLANASVTRTGDVRFHFRVSSGF